MREGNVRDDAASEKGADPSFGAIEELIRHQDIERPVLFLQASDGARRENALDAEHLEAIDVRAKIQLGWKNRVPGAVAGQEGDPFPAERADHVGSRRTSKRCLNRPFFSIGQLS